MVAHLLRLLNSSFYGLRQGIDFMGRAVAFIAMAASGVKDDGKLCLDPEMHDSIANPIEHDTAPDVLDKCLGAQET